MNSNDIRRDPERWVALQEAVSQGWSLNEMRRTYGFDHRMVKRHFPDYKAFRVGGGGEAQQIRNANVLLQKIDNHGIVAGTNRKETK